jgi:acyl-coenzyme A thioesterase PaaI-like protein
MSILCHSRTNVDVTMDQPRHILSELGYELARDGDELLGTAEVVPEMFVPGTASIRTSILATWTDMTCGILAVDIIGPRVPVTLELDVHLYEPAHAHQRINAVGRLLKAGRSVVVLTVDFSGEDGEPVGVGTASFMAAPNPALTIPSTDDLLGARVHVGGRLTVPLAERAGCRRVAPGVAEQPKTDEGLNSSKTLNGGLLALAIEEAALSLTPGTTLSSLAMRYLQPVRIGPAVATAEVRAGLGRVEVRDAGNDDRLSVVATTRVF